jgi:hypothetical protein
MLDSLVKSRRFWIAVSAIAVVLLKDKLPIDEQQMQDIILAVGAWIVGESLRSSKVSPPTV